MQTKLLRTLQEGTILRLGAKREISVNTRLVAATNRDLEHEVQLGAFREDLFYRLNVIPIRLPTLRERREDIRELAIHFLSRFNQANQRNVNLSAKGFERLQAYDWPGNIRELGNLIERVVLLGDKPILDDGDIERFLPSLQHNKPNRPASFYSGSSSMPASARSLIATGTISGLLSGMLGAGGGFVIVPALTRNSNLPIHSVFATSLAVITLVSISGVVAASVQGGVAWNIAIPFGTGAIVALLLGRLLTKRLQSNSLLQAFSVVSSVVAMALFAKGCGWGILK